MVKPKATVNRTKCLACGGCIAVCPSDALTMTAGKAGVDAEKCTSCYICVKTCPLGAVTETSV